MGEFATYAGQRVKIGTCEDLMYIRADQVELVHGYPFGSITNMFLRFPFPDEDLIRPGGFEDGGRGIRVDVKPPIGVDHWSLQLTSNHPTGYMVNIPCPEGRPGEIEGLKVQLNGYQGPIQITSQRPWNGHLALVARCMGCQAAYRYPTLTDCAEVLEWLHRKAQEERRPYNQYGSETRAKWYDTIAERIVYGYIDPPAWVKGHPAGDQEQETA